jgi:O-antigen ligase
VSLSGFAFATLFAVLAAMAFVRHPIYGVLAYQVAFYGHPPSRWWGYGLIGEIRWSLLASAVILLAVIVRRDKLISKPPVFRQSFIIGLCCFVVWISLQWFWALDPEQHSDFLSYYIKYIAAAALLYICIDREEHLRLFLWGHVIGCFYFGWLAFSSSGGGRFEDFGGPGLSEANSGGMQIITGIFCLGGLLFAATKLSARAALIGMAPFLLNGVIATVSRSGFLAAFLGGVVFNWYVPKRLRLRVVGASALGLLLLATLTNQTYWTRIETIKYAGQDVEGTDTGSGRLELLRAQARMFRDHPWGCGHACTETLSPSYLDQRYISQISGVRSSHNTFMSMLVEHGWLGGIFYFAMLVWIWRRLTYLRPMLSEPKGEWGIYRAITGAVLAAIVVGDMFVPYMKLEVRFWFLTVLMVLVEWVRRARQAPRTCDEP